MCALAVAQATHILFLLSSLLRGQVGPAPLRIHVSSVFHICGDFAIAARFDFPIDHPGKERLLIEHGFEVFDLRYEVQSCHWVRFRH